MNDTPWIVLLGGNELNAGLPQVARRRGARLLVVDWNDHPPVAGDRHLRIDIKDGDAVIEALGSLIERTMFAFTSSDAGTETAARIHASKGLLRPSADALVNARQKPRMNAIWQRSGLLGKRFRACRTLEELVLFRDGVTGDVIVKPAGGSSSRGVTVLRREDRGAGALSAAWRRAREIDGEVLVEDFIRGTEFTVEMLGDGAGHVHVWAISRKYHSAQAGRGRVANKLLYNPPDVSRARQLRLARFARRCFRALGLRACLGHFEMIERPDGRLVPVEIAARSSGFLASHLVDAVVGRGRTLLEAYEDVLHGGEVTDELSSPCRSAMFFFYDFPPGRGGRSGTNLTQFLPVGIESLACDRSKLVRGSRFDQIECDYERHGYEILVGDSDVLTIDAVRKAESAHWREFLAVARDAPGAGMPDDVLPAGHARIP